MVQDKLCFVALVIKKAEERKKANQAPIMGMNPFTGLNDRLGQDIAPNPLGRAAAPLHPFARTDGPGAPQRGGQAPQAQGRVKWHTGPSVALQAAQTPAQRQQLQAEDLVKAPVNSARSNQMQSQMPVQPQNAPPPTKAAHGNKDQRKPDLLALLAQLVYK